MIPFMLAGMTLLNGIRQANAAKATDITNESNVRIANTMRRASNELTAAQGALARMAQSVNNNNMLREGGKRQEEIGKQRVQLIEQMTTGTLKNRLQASAAAGALTAAAGSAGIGGSTVDQLDQVNNLQLAITEQANETQFLRDDFAITQAGAENVYQMYNNIDDTLIFDNLQVGEILAPPKQFQGYGGALLGAGASLLGNMYQAGMFSSGSTIDLSTSTGLSGLFSRATGGSGPSGYQLGAKLL